MADVAEVFSWAWQQHQAGGLVQAEQLYRQVLQADPNHVDAWCFLGAACQGLGKLAEAEMNFRRAVQIQPDHSCSNNCLGVLLAQQGRHAEAIASFQQALMSDPRNGGVLNNLGLALARQGRSDEAVRSYRQALECQPNYPEGHYNLGLELNAQGHFEAAALEFEQAVQHRPNYAEAWNDLGNALAQQKDRTRAVDMYRQALRSRPDYVQAHYNLGVVLDQLESRDEAMMQFQLALRIDPDHADAHVNLGNLLHRKDKFDEAVMHYRQALSIRPDFVEAHNGLANTLMSLGQFEEAAGHYLHALKLRPEFADSYYNLGVVYGKWRKLAEAIAWYRKALELRPDNLGARVNLGNALRNAGQMDEALAMFQETLRVDPECAAAHWNRSVVLLAQGDFEQGWRDYEWRWEHHSYAKRPFRQPLWDGSDLGGRTILLHAEQGLGDTLEFIRYAPLVKERGGRVVFECQAALVPIVSSTAGIDHLVARGSPLPEFDIQAPLLSLPGIFHTNESNAPRRVPYLHADPKLVEQWRRELEPLRGFKVGIAWQGNTTHPDDAYRSIPLAQFVKLANVEGVQFVSLQKGPGTEQIAALANQFPLRDLGSRLDEAPGPFMDTAAVIKNLDLVISSDTAVPHLAGALGARVWLALPKVPDWRWLLERDDSPWYPTMRLFRQTQRNQWDDVFDRITGALHDLVRRRA